MLTRRSGFDGWWDDIFREVVEKIRESQLRPHDNLSTHPHINTGACASSIGKQASDPSTCEPVSRLRANEARVQDRLAALRETISVLEGRLEPVLHFPCHRLRRARNVC